jgi:glycosyltransferase involved in cell wall biosynthesis
VPKTFQKKVLMLCFYFPPQFSGAALQALVLAEALRKRGLECEFVATASDGAKDVVRAFQVHRLGRNHWALGMRLWWFLLFRRRQYLTLHVHGFSKAHFLCVFAARLFGLSVVQKMTKGGEDNGELGRGGLFGRLRRLSLNAISDFVAISSPIARGIEQLGMRGRVHRIPNGVEASAYQPIQPQDRTSAREEYRIPINSDVVLCAGIIARRKNQLLILEALSELRERRSDLWPRVHLVIAGPSQDLEYWQELVSYAEAQSLCDHVQFIGALAPDEMRRLTAACDIAAFAGTNEGLPNVLIEAKAAGVPPIAYESDGVTDVIRNGVDGFVIPARRRAEFAEALARLLEEPVLRSRFAQNGREDVGRRFAIEAIADQYISAVYRIGQARGR